MMARHQIIRLVGDTELELHVGERDEIPCLAAVLRGRRRGRHDGLTDGRGGHSSGFFNGSGDLASKGPGHPWVA
jgi:hypothetical protein